MVQLLSETIRANILLSFGTQDKRKVGPTDAGILDALSVTLPFRMEIVHNHLNASGAFAAALASALALARRLSLSLATTLALHSGTSGGSRGPLVGVEALGTPLGAVRAVRLTVPPLVALIAGAQGDPRRVPGDLRRWRRALVLHSRSWVSDSSCRLGSVSISCPRLLRPDLLSNKTLQGLRTHPERLRRQEDACSYRFHL